MSAPAIRFSSVGDTGLSCCSAWRTTEAWRAILATRLSKADGGISALTATRPSLRIRNTVIKPITKTTRIPDMNPYIYLFIYKSFLFLHAQHNIETYGISGIHEGLPSQLTRAF